MNTRIDDRVREVPAYSIKDFLSTTHFSGASFSPDGTRILVSGDQSGIFNACALPVDGGDPVPLTHSTDDAIYALGYFPDDERFLITRDEGGDELNHIHVQSPEGGSRDLTPGDGLKAVFYGWAQDDTVFFIGTNERDQRFFDVYAYDAESYEREMIFRNEDGYNYAAASPDGRYLALSMTNSNADSDIFLYDRQKPHLRLLTPHDGDIQCDPQTFSKDGQFLYFLTDCDSEFMHLVRYDLASDTREIVLKDNWDLQYAYFSKHGKYLVVSVNRDARAEVRLYDATSMEPVEAPKVADAGITAVRISRDERRIAFYASSSRMPGDLFYYDLSGGKPRQLTRSLNAKIDPDDLVDGTVARFASFDGVEVPGILYRPHAAGETNKVPALVWVHGGPGGQSRVGYDALIQYLVNHGYAVYAINNRGSSGYGKTFFHLDDRRHGTDDLDDCVESKRLLAATGFVDPSRIGIMGGSYGGYMTLAALTFRPDAFGAGVDLFGISNWERTLNSIPPWWESFRAYLEKEMGPFDDSEFFRAKSPLFHAENIVRPLMVLQGANDPRVLKVESDEIVEKVRENEVPVEYVVFDDEGHGFVKKENQARGYRAILTFLDTYLKHGPTPALPSTPTGG